MHQKEPRIRIKKWKIAGTLGRNKGKTNKIRELHRHRLKDRDVNCLGKERRGGRDKRKERSERRRERMERKEARKGKQLLISICNSGSLVWVSEFTNEHKLKANPTPFSHYEFTIVTEIVALSVTSVYVIVEE